MMNPYHHMEELYGFQSSGCTVYYDELYSPSPFVTNTNQSCWSPSIPELDQLPRTASSSSSPKSAISDEASHVGAEFQTVKVTRTELDDENSLKLRAQIASHPLYPKLLDAYIGCQKVGAPKEIADLLDEIRVARREKEPVLSACQDSDPELDNFMESYCNTLLKYKSELRRPFDEAIMFLNEMEIQLSSLSSGLSSPGNILVQDEVIESSEEDFSGEEEFMELKRVIEDRELKDKLLQRYSGYLSSLKHEFSKKKKKGKLPKEATQILLEWWSIHLQWPYPTEAEKVALAEWTRLDQKQINNWFINQRKRHWKPTDQGMQMEVLDGLYGPFIVSEH